MNDYEKGTKLDKAIQISAYIICGVAFVILILSL